MTDITSIETPGSANGSWKAFTIRAKGRVLACGSVVGEWDDRVLLKLAAMALGLGTDRFGVESFEGGRDLLVECLPVPRDR